MTKVFLGLVVVVLMVWPASVGLAQTPGTDEWACCVAGVCSEQLNGDCRSVGGTYFPDQLCNDVSCPDALDGACCYFGGCEDGMTVTSCMQSQGVFQGANSNCDTANCSVVGMGACCVDGVCSNQTQHDCTTNGGTYYGDGNNCAVAANTCASPPQGACCSYGDCGTSTEADCIGLYLGNGSSCDIGCPPTGSCCYSNGTCQGFIVEAYCTATGGTYRGDGTICVTGDCMGACCAGDGNCTYGSLDACGSGTYQGGGTYCPQSGTCLGACCQSSGCQEVMLHECSPIEAFQGVGTSCQTACTGACCSAAGTCQDVQPAACETALGIFRGLGTNCDSSPCTGACCSPDGSCDDTPLAGCNELTGVFDGLGTFCQSTSCPQVGGCCLGNGQCLLLSQASCSEGSNVYFGDGTDCQSALCPTGACCMGDGTCAELMEARCEADAGIGAYKGDGSSCPHADCQEPTGACCSSDATCSTTTSIECSAEQGKTFFGDGTSCTAGLCSFMLIFEDGFEQGNTSAWGQVQ